MIQPLPPTKLLTILIVEDDKCVQDVLRDLLSERHECHIASSAEAARPILQACAFDLVFVDISLPGESGMELAGFIRQRSPELAIIFTTALTDEHYMEGARRLNAFAYLTKPFDVQTIIELVSYVEVATQPQRAVRQIVPAMSKAVERVL